MKKTLSLFALLLMPAILNASPASPEIGAAAPAFTLTDTHGKQHSLSDYKGKYVVLEWINYGCPFVRAHYDSGAMQKLQKEEIAKGVVWLTVCSSAPGKQSNMTPAKWNKTSKKHGSNATAVLIDANGKVGHAYDAKTTPDMAVINPKGDLIYKGAIDDIPSTKESDALKAKNYVKAALAEARAGKPVSKPETRPYGCSVKY